MVVAKDFELPSDEELNVQEINVGWAYIHAAAVFLGKKCESYNNEFMLCKYELKDPRKCLKEGRDVTNCALDGFRDIKKHCRDVFEAHVDCVVNSSALATQDQQCRETRKLFDNCMLEKLNLERPPFGYFCEPKVHDSPRPKPPPEVPPEFPDPLPDAPRAPYKPAAHGGRTGWGR